jgi:hypothetical protein
MTARVTFNVAEKPSVAKAIAELLSRGQFRKVLHQGFLTLVTVLGQI